MNPSELIGSRSLVANELVLNPNYPTGTSMMARHGYTVLGVHHQLTLSLAGENGLLAWDEWLKQLYASLMLLHANSQYQAQYKIEDLSDYLCNCWLCHLAFIEAQRDIKMMDWSWPTNFRALDDFWGPTASANAEANRSLKTTYCNKLNGYADSFYTTYPFVIPKYIEYVGELLSKVWKDDGSRRTNFHYFHLMHTPDTGSNTVASTFFDDMFTVIDSLTSSSLTGSMFTLLGEKVLTYITADLKQIYGDGVNQGLPLLFGNEPVLVDHNEALIRSLNNSLYGTPYLVEAENLTSTSYFHNWQSAAGIAVNNDTPAGWSGAMRNFTRVHGLTYGATLLGGWTTAIVNAANLNKLVKAINNNEWDIPMYDAFKGVDVLSDLAFTTFATYVTTATGAPAPDAEPDFSHASGIVVARLGGMFGFTIVRDWCYAACINGGVNASAFDLIRNTVMYVGSTVSPTQRPATFIPCVGTSAYNYGFQNSLAVSNCVDGCTTWQRVMWASGGWKTIFSDEDLDEMSYIECERLILTYASTSKTMFEFNVAVPKQSNKTEMASLDPKASKLKVHKTGGRSYGKKKWDKSERQS